MTGIADRFSLRERVIVVAGGGGGGIGTAVCQAAAELGAAVAVLDINQDLLALAQTAVESAGSRFAGHVVDVRDKANVDAAFDDVVTEFGRVDGLVNVVGGESRYHWQRMSTFDMAHFDEVINLNARYTVLTAQAAARTMRASQRPGSIVHISSVAAFSATPNQMAYGAAKAALLSLTRTMAVEWGPTASASTAWRRAPSAHRAITPDRSPTVGRYGGAAATPARVRRRIGRSGDVHVERPE